MIYALIHYVKIFYDYLIKKIELFFSRPISKIGFIALKLFLILVKNEIFSSNASRLGILDLDSFKILKAI
jgi:hypothetical protein